MISGDMGENNGEKKLQGLVSEAQAAAFQAVCKRLGLTQEKALGNLAVLFTRLPEPQQMTLSLALRDDEAFRQFIGAVDQVTSYLILSRLPRLLTAVSPAPTAEPMPHAREAIEQIRGLVAGIDEAGYRVLSETEQAAVNTIRQELGPAARESGRSEAEAGEAWIDKSVADAERQTRTRRKRRGA